ncbi:hypothetical protein COT72_02295 [archaeon CG10_big_fil_rev_8_21_14_0_10_43_11]|nr:MAG: hypothetical protein COT72_02295 [archaeon CG10_big_fil_rev_8_21_14_0_10_43_11]
MPRFVVATDIERESLEDFVNEIGTQKATAGLLLGDYTGHHANEFTDLTALNQTNRPVIMIAGNHENYPDYRQALQGLESHVLDISNNMRAELAGLYFVGNPGGTYFPANVKQGIPFSEKRLFSAIKSVKDTLDKTIVMSHIPARGFGDTAYFFLQEGSLIPGFFALEQNISYAQKIKPQPSLGDAADFMTTLFERYTPHVFLSGDIHENNAFTTPGKDLKTGGQIPAGQGVAHLAFAPGPYSHDPLIKYQNYIPSLKNKNWDRSMGILTLDNGLGSYRTKRISA